MHPRDSSSFDEKKPFDSGTVINTDLFLSKSKKYQKDTDSNGIKQQQQLS
jgi:hypothetical protein